MRIEPPVSVPTEPQPIPAATDAAGAAALAPAAGATGVPGVVALAVVRMDDPIGEFQEVALADQHRPSRLQATRDSRSYGWHPVAPEPRGSGRARAGRIDQILE